MVNYVASAATFLALTSLTATTIEAEERSTNLRRNNEQHRLRKLYGGGLSNSQFVSDTVTECEEVIDGNPPVCIKVCVEVTSITSGETLVDETSKVSQSKCESTSVEEVITGSPTNHPTYLATEDDETTIITHSYSPDIMKWTGDEDTVSSSAIDWIGDGYTSTTISDSNSIVIQNGSSSKSSKDGFLASSKGSKGEVVSSKSSKSVVGEVENVVISNGWSGSAQTTSDNIIVGSSKSAKYSTYNEGSSDVLDENGWYGSAEQSVVGESSSKSSKSEATSVGSAGSSKSSKSEDVENVSTLNSWYGSAQTIVTAAGSSKSSKSEGVEEIAATSTGWYGSAQIVSTAAGSSKSSKSEDVESIATSNGWNGSAQSISSAAGSSKSSKSEVVEEIVATSSGWYGSAQTVSTAVGSSKSSKSENVESVATSNGWNGSGAQTISSAVGSSKSSKAESVEENVVTSNGWSGSAQTIISSAAGSSSKSSKSEGSSGAGGDSSVEANFEYVTVSKPQSNSEWHSDGWQ